MRTMDNSYKTIRNSGYAEIIERSRASSGKFILRHPGGSGGLYPKRLKGYFDARHHCFAYIAGKFGGPEEPASKRRRGVSGERPESRCRNFCRAISALRRGCRDALFRRHASEQAALSGLILPRFGKLLKMVKSYFCMKGTDHFAATLRPENCSIFCCRRFSAPKCFTAEMLR